jgi:membrane-associated phospholipid phosphatase
VLESREALPDVALAAPADERHGWGRREALRLLGGMVVLTLLLLAIGLALTRWSALEGVREWDAGIAEWWVGIRTPSLDSLTHLGSSLADTLVAIAVTAVAFAVLRIVTGRWTASLVVLAAIGGELLYFLALTSGVGRDRPDVPKLDAAPPTSSYPSGHTGAAVALYVCLAVIVWRHVSNRLVAVPLVALLCLVPVAVGLSRMYRGMHFATDVAFGALGGLLWLLVVLGVLWPHGRPLTGRAAAEKEAAP